MYKSPPVYIFDVDTKLLRIIQLLEYNIELDDIVFKWDIPDTNKLVLMERELLNILISDELNDDIIVVSPVNIVLFEMLIIL